MSADDEGFSDMWIVPKSHGPVTRPRATVASGGAPLTSTVDQRVDNSINKPMPYLIGLAVIATAGLILAFVSHLDAQRAERETRMLEMYLLELDGKLIAAGFKTDAESIAKKLREQRNK